MKKQIKKTISLALAMIAVLACVTVAAHAANVANESAMITAVNKGGTVKLTADITLTDTLVIPAGKKVTLDLNGKVLDRGLTEPVEGGSVIRVEAGATLTVNDTTYRNAGVITGGCAYRGGGICNYGTLTVNGGRIMNNLAKQAVDVTGYIGFTIPDAGIVQGEGGGIYNAENASLSLQGGVITGNSALNGGGVYNAFGADLTVRSGSHKEKQNGKDVTVASDVTVTQNTAGEGDGVYSAGTMSVSGAPALGGNTDDDDLCLAYGKKFTCGALSITTPFGITANGKNVTVTEGYGANNPADPKQFFFSRYEDALIQLTAAENGEVRLKTDSTSVVEVYEDGVITKVEEFDSPTDAWNKAQSYAQPNWYAFEAPEMREKAEKLKSKYPEYYGSSDFSDWYDDIKSFGDDHEGSYTVASANMSLKNSKSEREDGYGIWEGCLKDDRQVKLTLGSDWTVGTRFKIERFRNIIIDLNGHYIDRGGKKQKDGNLFYLDDFAKLTIIDSYPNAKGYDGFKGGVITGGNGDDCGGGFILNDYSELNILGGTVYNCITDEHGGAIYADDPRAVINLKDCAFDSCKTKDSGDDCNGGALYLRNTMRVTMENVRFTNCCSEDNGGAIYMSNRPGTVKMKNVSFSKNEALDFGGALAIGDISDSKQFLLEAVGCTFSNNTSGKDGGAVCVSDNDDSAYKYPMVFRECSFTYNTSKRDGSALELDDSSVALLDCTVTNNTAKGHGAVYVNDARFLNVGGKTVIKNNTGENVYLDKDGDKTRVYSTGLRKGAEIVVNSDSGDKRTLLMKGVDKRQVQYFRGEPGTSLEFKETGSREATLTLASLFGKGSVPVLIVIAAAALLAAAYLLRKKKKLARAVICVALVVAMLATELMPKLSIRAEDANLYLEDIKIYVGDSEKDAKKYFDSIGYQYLDADLNEATGTGKYVYMGYKPTEDRDKAVTSIRMLPMQSGYQLYDYDELMAYMSAECADAALAMKKASDAFVENYIAGSPKARDAYLGLNMFYLGREDNILLGDYIVSGRADQAFYTDVLTKASSGAAQSISGLLNIGLAPFENACDEETGELITVPWASLISTNSLWAQYREGLTTDERDELNRIYGDQAYYLFHSIQDFTTNYENALARYEFNGGKVETNLDIDNLEEGAEALDEMTPEDGDVMYLAAYELLNSYDFDVETKLGDWFLNLGRQTSDEVDYFQLFPVLASMGEGLSSIISLTGFLSAVLGLGENEENEEFQKAVNELEGDFGEKGVGIIDVFANLDDLFKGKTFAYTSEAIRKSSAENRPISPLEKVEEEEAFMNDQFKKIGLVVGIGTLAVGALLAVAKIGLAITVSALSGATAAATAAACASSATYAFFSSAVFYLSGITSFLGYVSLGILAVSLIVMLCFYLYKSHVEENKADYQTEKPDFVYDAVEYNGVSGFALYQSALDNKGNVGDVNAAKQWKWVALCFSTDKGAGSPIVADETGQFFRAVKDDPALQNGYDCIRHFGERGPANFNANCSRGDQTYVHYTTEESLSRRAPETVEEPNQPEDPDNPATDDPVQPDEPVQYIRDIIIAIGKDAQEAMDAIVAHENKYYVLDYNLSPTWGNYTYLGYALTEDPKDAITDLRIAPYAGGPEMRPVMYGDIQYNQIGILGFYVGKGSKQGVPAADALFYTKDQNAGSPLTADSLHPITNREKAEEGWEPVSYFGCDFPYNFNTQFGIQNKSLVNYVSDYGSSGSHLDGFKKVWLYYEPSEKYTSGEKYLSGMFFAGGYYDVVYSFNVEDGTFMFDPYDNRFLSIVDSLPRCEIASDVDLAYASRLSAGGNSSADIHLCLYYTWTYNPKRAVTNLAIFQGDTFASSLPYALAKPAGNVSCNYVAAINWQQQYMQTFGTSPDEVIRFVAPQNTYMNHGSMVLNSLFFGELLNGKYTVTKPEGVDITYEKMRYLPTGLYVCGYAKGLQPLTLDDVILLSDESSVKQTIDGGRVNYEINSKTLAGTDPEAGKSFRPISEMKNPNSTTLFNLSYPSSIKCKTKPLYLFLRGQQETKKQYIASLSVGSFSREQYKETKPKASDDELEAVDGMVNLQAMVGAFAGCTDEMKVYNFALEDQSEAWYHKQKDGMGSSDAPKNRPAAYIGVSRTDSATDAIKGVILYKSKAAQAPNTIEIEKVSYTCAGTSAPIYMKGEKYFLYYTKNSGAIPGAPIRDLVIDDLPMLDGTATNLCVNEGETRIYGNTKQTNYIHLICDQTNPDFYNKLYIGQGADEKEAQLDLLAQGCVQYVKINLNKMVKGNVILLGYRQGRYDWEKINTLGSDEEKQAEIVKQQKDAVYDIVVTKDEPFHPEGVISKGVYYSPVSSVSLNAGCPYGSELYMYIATPYYSESYNKKNNASTLPPETVFSSYIKRLAFAENERVPYTKLLVDDPAYKKAVEAAAAMSNAVLEYLPWEYVLQIGDTGPIDLNDGAVYCNRGYCEENRLHMFVQRSDGSVKPAGEITGGFVENTYAVGDLYIKK